MDTLIANKAEFLIAVISEFAKRHRISDVQAFSYLDRYEGLHLVEEHYGIAHTLSFGDVVDALTTYCHRNGGDLS